MKQIFFFVLLFLAAPSFLFSQNEIEKAGGQTGAETRPPSMIPFEQTPQGKKWIAEERFVEITKSGELFGCQNRRTGVWVVEPVFESIEAPFDNWMIAQKDGKRGIIGKNGQIILPFEFENIQRPWKITMPNGRDSTLAHHFVGQKGGLWGIFEPLGRQIIAPEWRSIMWVNEYALLEKRGEQLILDAAMKPVLHRNFEEFALLNDNENMRGKYNSLNLVRARDPETGKMGLLDFHDRVVLPFEYLVFEWGTGNFVCAAKENYSKFGIVNLQGRAVLPADFDKIQVDAYGFFLARQFSTKKIGVFDTLGRARLSVEFESCGFLKKNGVSSTLIIAQKKGEMAAVFDTSGRRLTEPVFVELEWPGRGGDFSELVFGKTADEKWHFFNQNDLKISAPFDDFVVKNMAILLEKEGFFAFLKTNGAVLTGFKFQNARAYVDKKRANQLAKECGLSDGRWIIGDAVLADGRQVFIDDAGGEHFLKN